MSADALASWSAATAVVCREGALLDQRRWDEWLEQFTEDCVYWMPMWRDDETLNQDPERELSYIYYSNRAGLADRIVRIRSGRSPASTPMPRTSHMVGNLVPIGAASESRVALHASWNCHVLFTRSARQHVFFGIAEYELVNLSIAGKKSSGGRAAEEGSGWRIARKKIVLHNDEIPAMLDIYCV